MRYNPKYAGMTFGEASVQRAKDRAANAEANAAKKAARDRAVMTCQCCGRAHLANTGKMAHHGFQRPGYGWQTASCYGARELPFEVSRDRLGALIELLKRRRTDMITMLGKAEREEISFSANYTDYSKRDNRGRSAVIVVEVTRATWVTIKAAHDPMFSRHGRNSCFDDIKDTNLKHRNSEIKAIGADIEACQLRYDGWKKTHTHFNSIDQVWIKA